eukprot:TRINITY_DN30324_c0_g1_i1.p1 TRINITY_DN30324_c0_g1~~TRINITY_DN30324_c0_g1_i1.p1  ORF type:complete len:926 (-),score=256.63 TRINITY_DN30324_c0_g1_i1:234-3011(-)
MSEVLHNPHDRLIERRRVPCGGNISHLPIVFSEKEDVFYACAGVFLKSFASTTGTILRVFEGHTLPLTSVHRLGKTSKILTTSMDGSVRVWDGPSGTLLSTFSMEDPISAAHVISETEVLLVLEPRKDPATGVEDHVPESIEKDGSSQKRDKKSKDGREKKKERDGLKNRKRKSQHRLLKFSLDTHETEQLLKIRGFVGLSYWRLHNIVVCFSKKKIHLVELESGRWNSISHDEDIVCAAAGEPSRCMAVGCKNGQIVLFFIPNVGKKRSQAEAWEIAMSGIRKQRFHWHAHAVRDMRFSLSGRYLLSVGEEGVLTFYSLENASRAFVPRISRSALTRLVETSDHFVISCEDNSIRYVNKRNRRLERIHAGLLSFPENSLHGNIPHMALRTESHLLMCGIDRFQLFDVDSEKEISSSLLTHARQDVRRTFANKQYVLSVDDAYNYLEVYEYTSSDSLMLQSKIYFGGMQIISAIFHPKEPRLFITLTSDGKMKVWFLPSKSDMWELMDVMDHCITNISPTQTGLEISSDGSLLAFYEQHRVHLFSVLGSVHQRNVHLQFLDTNVFLPSKFGGISVLRFIPESTFIALVDAKKKRLVIVNLLSRSVWWEMDFREASKQIVKGGLDQPVSVGDIVIDSSLLGSHFLALVHVDMPLGSKASHLLVFDPSSPVVLSQMEMSRACEEVIMCGQGERIYAMDCDGLIHCLRMSDGTMKHAEGEKMVNVDEGVPAELTLRTASIFDQYATLHMEVETRTSSVEKRSVSTTMKEASNPFQAMHELIHGPAYALPSMDVLADRLLKCFLSPPDSKEGDTSGRKNENDSMETGDDVSGDDASVMDEEEREEDEQGGDGHDEFVTRSASSMPKATKLMSSKEWKEMFRDVMCAEEHQQQPVSAPKAKKTASENKRETPKSAVSAAPKRRRTSRRKT